MNRTLPFTTKIAFKLMAELKPFYEALCLSDRLILDRFFEITLQHRVAMDRAKDVPPMEVISLAILLEERKRNNDIFIELFNQIEELEKRLIFLLPPEDLEMGGF